MRMKIFPASRRLEPWTLRRRRVFVRSGQQIERPFPGGVAAIVQLGPKSHSTHENGHLPNLEAFSTRKQPTYFEPIVRRASRSAAAGGVAK